MCVHIGFVRALSCLSASDLNLCALFTCMRRRELVSAQSPVSLNQKKLVWLPQWSAVSAEVCQTTLGSWPCSSSLPAAFAMLSLALLYPPWGRFSSSSLVFLCSLFAFDWQTHWAAQVVNIQFKHFNGWVNPQWSSQRASNLLAK